MFDRSQFPEGFLWGAATSAYQIEGGAQGGAGRTHWDDFAATPGNVEGAENGDVACDHIGRMDEDLDLLKDLGLDIYRFSTSWARVLPEGTGTPNQKGLDFYDRLVDGLLERGLKPAWTLYHWELPSVLADKGGWRNRDIGDWFAEYADLMAARIGDRVWSAAPINEPWCVAWLSHFEGVHAPGLRDIRAAARAMHHVLYAHGRAVEVLRGANVSNVGAVCNFEYSNPASDSEDDRRAARTYDAIYNRFFTGGLFHGAYPEEVLEGLEPHLPHGWQDDMPLIGQKLDWLGVNYYTRKNIAAAPGPWPALAPVDGSLPKTQVGWEIYPEGLRHFLNQVARDAPGLPIYVTENGLAAEAPHQDDQRISYLTDHIEQARRAMAEDGVPLAGYITWSLLDNYEWSLGYGPRFGLVHVDYDTLERSPKASYHALKSALKRSA
ncbi:GH1 family beta-glucosidase [Tropicimonas sp. IMCC34011]|uniref:GH1 family beta-glucosidase n=1 Tax=Tropicimonas sp. IMCC34011 TaxID=2248759 RepID=UPI000E272851|nr:GH1 family beta-glucosidase [Tropicimonas sp. IMCC34011]